MLWCFSVPPARCAPGWIRACVGFGFRMTTYGKQGCSFGNEDVQRPRRCCGRCRLPQSFAWSTFGTEGCPPTSALRERYLNSARRLHFGSKKSVRTKIGSQRLENNRFATKNGATTSCLGASAGRPRSPSATDRTERRAQQSGRRPASALAHETLELLAVFRLANVLDELGEFEMRFL